MAASPTSHDEEFRPTPVPDGAASLESILCTEELRQRPARAPDYAKENRALVALAAALAESPTTILQTLSESIIEVTGSDSAGVSLLTTEDGGKRFYWPAIAGVWSPHVGGGTPRDFGPCGDVLDRNASLLFRHLERRYTYFQPVTPPAVECLLVPFYVGGKAVGTIWSLIHGDDRKFDAEHERLMGVLGKVASLAYQTLGSIDDLKFQIEERQKAEAALRELNETLAWRVEAETRERVQIWCASQDLLVIAGLDGKYLSVNPAWAAILGWSETDLLGKSSQWFLHPDDRERTRAELDRLAKGQKTLRFENRLRAKDGSYRWVSWKATPDGGRIYATGRDVTELKRAEEKHERLRQLEADLAHVNRLSMMGELAASLAHEVKQPIAATRNNASAALNFLDKNPPNLDKARLALGFIAEDSDRAGDIIDRIRDQTKKAPPRRNRFDLNEAVKEVIALAQSEIEKNGVSVRIRLAEWLPPVHGDRVQVQQVILNLILNAAEAMASVDARPRELSISTEQSQINGVLVVVRDSGPGIDPEHVDRIFDAFYTTKSAGMGMGLSICRSIIHAHEGRLWADANEPRGAIFQFTLPSAETGPTNAAQPVSLTGEPHQCT